MTDQIGQGDTPVTRSSGAHPFGALLRAYRRERELRQEELAEQAGISVYTISNLERGVAQAPHLDTIRRLAAALDLSPSEEAALLGAARHTSAHQDRRRHALSLAPAPLPHPLTPLIGRERELGDLVARLQRAEARLVTLVGLGGVGKTRLALAAAHALASMMSMRSMIPAGVTWIPLAALRDPALVLGALAEAVGAREVPARSLAMSLRDTLADPARLLILDNFEHLLSAAPDLTALLEDCPRLRLLVTSRAPLSVRGEQVVDVRPLPTLALLPAPRPMPARRVQRSPDPPSGDATRAQIVLASPAVALFLTCARATRSDLEVDPLILEQIASICHRLDGLPLAIELAAATARTLNPAEVLARLDHLLDVLGGSLRDLPERQQSLRATLRWSYELLPPPAQTLFRQLGVCVGGCALAAARALLIAQKTVADDSGTGAGSAVAAGDTDGRDQVMWEALEPLLTHQLAWPEPVDGADPTASALPSTPFLSSPAPGAAAKAGEPDGRPDRSEARIALLETIRAFAAERLRAAGEEAVARAAHARYFLQVAEAAAGDLKGADQSAALARLDRERANLYAALGWCVETGEATMAMRLAGALGLYWEVRGLIGEGRAWFERVLAVADAQGAVQERAGDAPASAGTTWRSLRARAVNGAGALAMWHGDYPAATVRLEEALAIRRELGDERAIAASVNNLGGLALLVGDYRRARALWEETLLLRVRVGEPRGVALAQLNCGIIAHRQGRSRQARGWLVTAEAAFETLGDQAMRALALAGRGEALRQRGAVADARAALTEGLALARSVGRANAVILALSRLGELARLEGQVDEGLEWCEEALTVADEQEEVREMAQILLVQGGLWLERGEHDRAAECVRASQNLCEQFAFRQGSADVALWQGRLALSREEYAAAREEALASLALRHALGTVVGAPECLETLASATAHHSLERGDAQAVDESVRWLCAIADRARDGAPAVRSPREQQAYASLMECLFEARPAAAPVSEPEDAPLLPAGLDGLFGQRSAIVGNIVVDLSLLLDGI
jgi:predicted ATPase/DNA-binding XRE family transcriptional regulator